MFLRELEFSPSQKGEIKSGKRMQPFCPVGFPSSVPLVASFFLVLRRTNIHDLLFLLSLLYEQ